MKGRVVCIYSADSICAYIAGHGQDGQIIDSLYTNEEMRMPTVSRPFHGVRTSTSLIRRCMMCMKKRPPR